MIEDQAVHEAHDDFIDHDARSSPSNLYEIIRQKEEENLML